MFESLASYIKDIALFMIFITMVQAVMPKSKFKEFIGVVLGIMLVFIVLSPVASLISGKSIEGAVGDVRLMFERNLMDSSNLYSDEQNAEILRLYKGELEEQMTRLISNSEKYIASSVSVRVSDSGEDFGAILSIHISLEEKAPVKDSLIRIEPVNPVMWGQKADEPSGQNTETEQIKSQISGVYSVPAGNIYILVRE